MEEQGIWRAVKGWRMNVMQCIRVNWLIVTDTPLQTHCLRGHLHSTNLYKYREEGEADLPTNGTCS